VYQTRQNSWEKLGGGHLDERIARDFRGFRIPPNYCAKLDTPSPLDFIEDRFIPFPIGRYGIVMTPKCITSLHQHLLDRFLESCRRVISEHRLVLINHGWNHDGLVLNFKTDEDRTLFKMFWVADDAS